MSATRLLVLGVVRMYGQAHGYQVRRELLSWSADTWANVAPGSIYHALKQMAREKLLAEVTLEEGESGPARTVYRLTEDGETEFNVLLTRALCEPERGQDYLSGAITFLTALTRKQAIDLLQVRASRLTGQLASVRHGIDSSPDVGKPAHVDEAYRLWALTIEAHLRWVADLVDRLQRGDYTMADDSAEHFGHRA